jgi:ribosomal protein S18 acetylase RimI-like enzyme
MTPVSVRTATPDDLLGVAGLFDRYRQFYEQRPDLELATHYLSERMNKHESVILVAEDSERSMVGFCQLYPTFCSVSAAPIYVLYDLFVGPEVRRAGAGRALLTAARQVAIEAGMSRLDLSTAKTNATAQALYESLGWQRDELFYTYSLSLDE